MKIKILHDVATDLPIDFSTFDIWVLSGFAYIAYCVVDGGEGGRWEEQMNLPLVN